ncbi:MAG: isoprenoid biosynthesis protein ElbB [Candidatus Marinimicrobia bacterium]|nr:isoprenoid biosynthesis protein ElbB [Candidatus Neomarinimicrobiota bacterium]|tara:strand:+ start:4029 stop:4688 length:660 start_codon:yes stop_codon:yes gene_type:complete
MQKVGVVLAGCGAKDGAEIHESVLTLLALDRAGVKVRIMAPNIDQFHVVNHSTNNEYKSKRNVLSEAARIARGDIVPLEDIKSDELDVLIFPGGTGMAKNIFNYIIEGPNFTVIKDVESLTRDMIRKNKPIGAICIAPVMIAKILQNMNRGGKVTGGFDEKISADIESMGINIKKVDARNIVVDNKNKIVSTPAYVEAKSIKDVAIGIDKLVNKVLEMV